MAGKVFPPLDAPAPGGHQETPGARHIFPALGRQAVSGVSPRELLEVLRRLEARSPATARRARGECSRIFCYAIATGRAERDAAAGLRGALAPLPARHYPTLTRPEAIGKLLLDIENYSGGFAARCALRLAPHLFVRAGELVGAEWEELDLEQAEWRIAARRMKKRRPHIVPLSSQSLAILQSLRPFSGQGRYVFPGRGQTSAHLHRCSLLSALRRLGYARRELNLHSFRSMASTLLNEQGYNRDWIERQLAHSEGNGARAAYNHAEYLPERRVMMQQWSDWLSALLSRAGNAGLEEKAG